VKIIAESRDYAGDVRHIRAVPHLDAARTLASTTAAKHPES